jgi:hypothetical protein
MINEDNIEYFRFTGPQRIAVICSNVYRSLHVTCQKRSIRFGVVCTNFGGRADRSNVEQPYFLLKHCEVALPAQQLGYSIRAQGPQMLMMQSLALVQ